MPATVEMVVHLCSPSTQVSLSTGDGEGAGHGPVGKALAAQEWEWSLHPQYPHKCWVGVACNPSKLQGQAGTRELWVQVRDQVFIYTRQSD